MYVKTAACWEYTDCPSVLLSTYGMEMPVAYIILQFGYHGSRVLCNFDATSSYLWRLGVFSRHCIMQYFVLSEFLVLLWLIPLLQLSMIVNAFSLFT